MSNDFKKVLVKDDRLMVSDSIEYAVFKGGQNVVPSQQPSISSSSSSAVQFNIQVPSEQTLVDRRVMLTATAQIQVTVPAGFTPVYGQNFALAAFPLHQLATTIQTTINNNSTSINIRDVLPAILKTNDCAELLRQSSTTPVMPDVLKTYYLNSASTGTGMLNNILGGYECSGPDYNFRQNGAFVGYGSYNAVAANATNVIVAQIGSTQNYTITFTTCEPLICPPFSWNEPESNNSAIYGVQNMNIVVNLGPANRCVRVIAVGLTAGAVVSNFTNVTLNSVSNASLFLNYITPHPSDLLPARNVVPYLEYPRYFSSSSNPVPVNGAVTVSSSTFNLNQIPDKLIIFARKPQNLQTPSDSDYSFPISGVSINFNNNSGILSSATINDLFRYSVEAGSTQSFDEFSGVTNVGAGVNYGAATGNQLITTVGSYLMLDFGKHIQLTEDYYAPGSLGNFQIQFNLTLQGNYQTFDGTTYESAISPEIVLVTVNSGIFVTERGQSSVYTGILTKQDVLDASQSTPLSQSNVQRVIGGGASRRGKVLNVHKMKQLHYGLPQRQSAQMSMASPMSGGAMRHPLSSRLM